MYCAILKWKIVQVISNVMGPERIGCGKERGEVWGKLYTTCVTKWAKKAAGPGCGQVTDVV